MSSNSQMSASVVIPTYNGIEFLEKVLNAIFSQKTLIPFEVIIIDSGSKDGTLEVLSRFSVKLVQIPKAEYGHGRTRNLGASLAIGDVIVYLTQDAIPIGQNWLQSILDHFQQDKLIQCVYGLQVPRENVNPFVRKDMVLHFEGLVAGKEVRCDSIGYSWEDWSYFYANEGVLGFNSNVCSAIRRLFLLRHPFPDVIYAEDQIMGRKVIRLGYKKVFALDVQVEHSHQFPLNDYFKRYFDEYRGLQITLGYQDSVQLRSIIPLAIRATLKDIKYIEKNMTVEQRKQDVIRLFLWGVVYHSYRRLGAYLGGRHYRLPIKLKKLLSLERVG